MTSAQALVSMYDTDVFELHERLHELFPGHRVETDPRGAVHLAAATDDHVVAVTRLTVILANAVQDSAMVLSEKFIYQPAPGLTRNEPDVIVLHAEFVRRDDYGVFPAPLLIAEIASPSTRAVDRTRKADDYLRGNVGLYLLVDPPGVNGADVHLELREPTPNRSRWKTTAEGPSIGFSVAGHEIDLDGAALSRTRR